MSDFEGAMHRTVLVDGRFVCKDTCPGDDCEAAMAEWNGENDD